MVWFCFISLSPSLSTSSQRSTFKYFVFIFAYKLCMILLLITFIILTHTCKNTENYLLTPSPQGDLCVAKLFPPRPHNSKASSSDPGHSSSPSSRVVRCEAS